MRSPIQFDLGPELSRLPLGTLQHVLQARMREERERERDHKLASNNVMHGMALEFGVGAGTSARLISQYMPVFGFDSFKGLPEDWRPGFPKGRFRQADIPPLPSNVYLAIGLFEDTLPVFTRNAHNFNISLIHIDCDLYSSTKTVLRYIGPYLKVGTWIVFDEYWGYEGCENHEMKAWHEYVQETCIPFEVIGHGPEQWAIRITDVNGEVR